MCGVRWLDLISEGGGWRQFQRFGVIGYKGEIDIYVCLSWFEASNIIAMFY
jgi:hypothetical protein